MTSKQTLAIAGAIYALGAIATFGHAAAASQRQELADYQQCLARKNDYCWRDDAMPGMNGTLGAMLWPLYWSWEAWS